jgi:hypothetical protein
MKILIAADDHSYRPAVVRHIPVVYNTKYRTYCEYHGEEYLEEHDQVVEMPVAE